jgi:CheY-like chemotaxis protein
MAETLLIVDDDPQLLRITQMLFDLEGYHVVVAKSGEQALEILTQLMPSAILLDVMMPGVDGLEVCRRVRADKRLKDIPIAVFTAADRREDELVKAGANAFIVKPYSIDGLRDTVRELIDGAQAEEEG